MTISDTENAQLVKKKEKTRWEQKKTAKQHQGTIVS